MTRAAVCMDRRSRVLALPVLLVQSLAGDGFSGRWACFPCFRFIPFAGTCQPHVSRYIFAFTKCAGRLRGCLAEGKIFALGGVVVASLALMLVRPKRIGEAWWVGGGVVLLLLTRLLPWRVAGQAVAGGTDVYLFLIGMMLLSELAREHGVFDWLAAEAVKHARGSQPRLFALVYATGAAVTALLSNDATAVVLTPAVLVAVQRAGGAVDPTPFLFACAMIANSGSFLLPMANLGNLVVYGGHMPGLGLWLKTFLLPACVSVGVTFGALRWWFRGSLRGVLPIGEEQAKLSREGRWVLWGIAALTALLLVASALEWQLGLPTFVATAALIAAVSAGSGAGVAHGVKQVTREVSWSVVLLTAGLFCLVAAVERAGLLAEVAGVLTRAVHWPYGSGVLGVGMGVGLMDNLTNNLPAGLLAGHGVQRAALHGPMASAVLIGTDLGPNLSVIGSLSTLLWLMRVRREGVKVSGVEFLKVGLLAMPLALLTSLAVVALLGR